MVKQTISLFWILRTGTLMKKQTLKLVIVAVLLALLLVFPGLLWALVALGMLYIFADILVDVLLPKDDEE